jgi:hypothetical protein
MCVAHAVQAQRCCHHPTTVRRHPSTTTRDWSNGCVLAAARLRQLAQRARRGARTLRRTRRSKCGTTELVHLSI